MYMLSTATLPEIQVMAEVAKHDVGAGWEGDGYGWACPDFTCWESETDLPDMDAALDAGRRHVLAVLDRLMHEHGVSGIHLDI